MISKQIDIMSQSVGETQKLGQKIGTLPQASTFQPTITLPARRLP
jgi:hypothetical protein